MHCGGRSSVHSFCFLLPIILLLPFSSVHVPTMLFEVLSNNKADCMLRFQLRVKRYYTYHIIRLALQNNISLRNGNMTTCPTDALKDNQSNPYPEGMKPKPKHPSSVSKLISLFWKKGSNSRICISLHERKSALCNSVIFL